MTLHLWIQQEILMYGKELPISLTDHKASITVKHASFLLTPLKLRWPLLLPFSVRLGFVELLIIHLWIII